MLGGGVLLMFDKDRAAGQAFFLAASAFGNCGLVLGKTPEATGWQTHLVLVPLMALGGFGLTVLIELFDLAVRRRPLSGHARTVLGMAAVVYVGATLLLTAARYAANTFPTDAASPWAAGRDLLATSAATAVNARTAGMPLDPLGRTSKAAVWIVMGLMAVGAAPGGTGGGVKSTTLAEVFRGVRRALAAKRRTPVRRRRDVAGWLRPAGRNGHAAAASVFAGSAGGPVVF